MPINDIRSDLDVIFAVNSVISSDTTTNGTIIDTAHYDLGVMFAFSCVSYTDGTYTPVLEESDDPSMVGATPIPADNIIGSLSDSVLTAQTALGAKEPTVGIFGTKKYIRVNIVSTLVTTGASIVVKAIAKGELLPVAE